MIKYVYSFMCLCIYNVKTINTLYYFTREYLSILDYVLNKSYWHPIKSINQYDNIYRWKKTYPKTNDDQMSLR